MIEIKADHRHDRIVPLRDLSHYPGSSTFDMMLYLPWSKDIRRHLWLMGSGSRPIISIDETTIEPQRTSNREYSWADYGTVRLPIITEPNFTLGGFHHLRIRGMELSECRDSYLVITTKLALSLDNCSPEEAERKLWGLARCDAGETTLEPSCLPAGSGATFTVKYSACSKGLAAGALIRFAVPKTFTNPQTKDPDTSGYISIHEADCRVSIVTIEQSIESHEKIDIICYVKNGLSPSAGFSLRYRTERMYIFPGEFMENERRTWFSHLPPLSAAVALSKNIPFVSLEKGHTFKVVPGPCERLHLFLPGRRFSSETLSLRGTFTDHYRNSPPSGTIMAGIELCLLKDEDKIPLETLTDHFTAGHRFEIPLPHLAPGIYRAFAYKTDTLEELARSNPLEIIAEPDQRIPIYWGEIHGHTEMSDGSGDYSELYRHAKDEGCLDFAAASDHAEYISDNQWLRMQYITNSHNIPGRFVTLLGYEWSGKQKDRNIYTSRSQLKLFRGGHHLTNDLSTVWGFFHDDEKVVGGPHATMVHRTVWEHHDSCVECFAEIYSMWGASDFRNTPLVPQWIEDERGLTVNDILLKGAKLGFTGGSDCHEGHCGFSSEDPNGQGFTPHTFAAVLFYRSGMTAAVMPDLNRTSLVRAVRDRQTYATTGARILLDFTVSGFRMGSTGEADQADCRANINAVQPICLLEIIKNGCIVWSEEIEDLDVTFRWLDPVLTQEENYYYLHIVQADGQMAWSSPVWIRQIKEPRCSE